MATIQKSARRRRIATKVAIEGKSIAQAAREVGVTREHASREFAADETQHFIGELIAQQAHRLPLLMDETFSTIEHAYHAKRRAFLKDGREVTGGPDHYARLTAVGRFIKLITTARKIREDDKKTNDLPTWDQVLALWRQEQAPQ